MGMRRLGPQVAAVALTVLVCFLGTHSTPTADAQTAPAKPNFVFILADDMREDDLGYMPKTRSLLGGKGTRFDKAYVSLPVCCPARSTIMRGQYAHNTGVWVNSQWAGYKANGNEQDNVATRLDAAGYRTGLFGKYLNGYDGSTIPAGWDRWHAHIDQRYYDYDVNVDGRLTHFGTAESDYSTDVIKRQTQNFVATSSRRSSPFFAYVAPKAPHGPFNGPVPRHQHDFDGAKAPRPPSFNEQDVSDKPPWIRSLPRLTTAQIAAIDERQEGRAESLQALDDLVGGVVTKLRDSGQLGNTYVVFTSDNGFHMGEHRIPDEKAQPYEESVHVPLLIRGPGVQVGARTGKLALNTDYLPTFTDLAGIQTPAYVDGRSLRPVLEANSTAWRSAILLEQRYGRGSGVTFSGILTREGRKYVEYEGGERELYDLGTDPYELTNRYAGTPPAGLASRLQELKSCSGDSCRAAEDGP